MKFSTGKSHRDAFYRQEISVYKTVSLGIVIRLAIQGLVVWATM